MLRSLVPSSSSPAADTALRRMKGPLIVAMTCHALNLEPQYSPAPQQPALARMTAVTKIRSPETADASQIATLLAELGYPATSEEVVSRLDRLEKTENALVLIAENETEVVGLVTCHLLATIHATPIVAWLTALVVHANHQGGGVGRELVAAVERWARDNGAVKISVTSGSHRAGAHEFYRRCGYESSGVRLTKALV